MLVARMSCGARVFSLCTFANACFLFIPLNIIEMDFEDSTYIVAKSGAEFRILVGVNSSVVSELLPGPFLPFLFSRAQLFA